MKFKKGTGCGKEKRIKNMKWDMDAVAKSKENFTRKNVVELQQVTTEEWMRRGYGFMKEEE